MAKKKVVKEATVEDEKLLKSVTNNEADKVKVRNRTFKVRWMHPYTTDRITCLALKDGNDGKILCQGAALIALNGFWKAKFFYWIVWRWFYYIRQYTAKELIPLMEMAQKKTAQEAATDYLNAMMYLHALNDATKQMTKEEARRILQELRLGSDGK